MAIKPFIVAAWERNGQQYVDCYAVLDSPKRRQVMQDWCNEMNCKYPDDNYFIHEFLGDDSGYFDAEDV